jgi:hypothetical protein
MMNKNNEIIMRHGSNGWLTTTEKTTTATTRTTRWRRSREYTQTMLLEMRFGLTMTHETVIDNEEEHNSSCKQSIVQPPHKHYIFNSCSYYYSYS